MLHGDWRRVERDVTRGRRLRARGEDTDLPASLAAVVDSRAKAAAEARRLAELRRFELARFTSSLQRRKGLALAESALAALCSLRAFYAQAGHGVADAATASHVAHTAIANACDAERAPWDYRMLKLQEVLNAMPHLAGGAREMLEADPDRSLPDLLNDAESAYAVYGAEARLETLYAASSGGDLGGYLWCQQVPGFGRSPGPWTRRYFQMSSTELRVARDAPSTIAGLVQAALARELSEEDAQRRRDEGDRAARTSIAGVRTGAGTPVSTEYPRRGRGAAATRLRGTSASRPRASAATRLSADDPRRGRGVAATRRFALNTTSAQATRRNSSRRSC